MTRYVLAFLAGIAAYHVALVSLHKFTYMQSGVGSERLDVDRLAKALPDWTVEHPVGQTEDELRATIAANIAAEYDGEAIGIG